jgi:hypothetical protein
MVDTHCLPTGSLGTNQIAVNQVGADTVTTIDPGAGNRRGICVFMHPSTNSDGSLPYSIPNGIGDNIATLSSSMTAAPSGSAGGWVFTYPAYPMDWSVNGVGYFGNLYNDVANDSGHGARFVTTLGLWMDHMVTYLNAIYGPGHPVILGGFSLGAYAAVSLALNNSPSGMKWNLAGYFAHCLPTIWEDITIFAGYNLASLTWTGMDLGVNALNSVTIPGVIGYSNSDGYVGWTNNSSQSGYVGGPLSNTFQIISNASGGGHLSGYVAASTAVPATYSGSSTTLASLGSLSLSAAVPSWLPQSGSGSIVTGSGTASFTFTSWSGSTLSGVSYSLGGSSTVGS